MYLHEQQNNNQIVDFGQANSEVCDDYLPNACQIVNKKIVVEWIEAVYCMVYTNIPYHY